MASRSRFSAASPYFLSVLRIVTAFLFLSHGAQKLFGAFGGHRMPMMTLFGAAGLLEVIGGSLLLVGLFTRVAAFVLCGEMAVAYFRAHAPNGWHPLVNHGEPAVLYCFVFLYLIFAGGGLLSADALIRKRD